MEVQKVLSNEESTPITFEFYSHGACGTDNATTSYSRHACLVHQVLIQRHALFPVAESFKETTVTMYTLLPTPHRFLLRLSRNLDTLGFARVNKNEGCKGGGGVNGEGSEIRGGLGPMAREGAFKKVQRFSFSRFDYVPFVRPPSLHPSMEKTKGVPCWVSTFCHNPGLLASCFRGAEGRRRRIFFSIVKTNFP